jgi:hypothetical protein
MRVRTAALFAGLAALSACTGPQEPSFIVDAAVDAAPDAGDAGRCPGELFLTGPYVDWDSTDAAFHGIPFATFQIENDPNPLHMDQTSPNGRAEMCIPATGRSLIKVTPQSGDMHLPAHFIADAAVFTGGRTFAARGATPTRLGMFFTDQMMTYDSTKADLEVEQLDTPVALTLTGATAAKTLSSPDGITWTPDSTTGVYVLFANVTVTGTPHLDGPSIGAGDLPMQPGELTITTVVGLVGQ